MPVPDIRAKSWDQFLTDFRSEWKPGQHIAIIAPTGQGKTTVLVSLLELRNFVLGFDPKVDLATGLGRTIDDFRRRLAERAAGA